MKRIFYLLGIVGICIQACNVKDEQHQDYPKEIKPVFTSYPDSVNFKNGFIDNRGKVFNLNSISEGINDSLEIRVWPIQHLSSDTRGFDFKITKDATYSGWVYYTPQELQMNAEGKNINASGEVVNEKATFQSKQLIPLSGWKAFYDSLKSFGIMQLPDQDSLKNPHGGQLGTKYSIEITTPNSYRRIAYDNYGGDETHEECFRVMRFIYFLHEQFREDYWWPHPID